jgi:hypothetical protein
MALLTRLFTLFHGAGAKTPASRPPQSSEDKPVAVATPTAAARTVDLIRSQARGLGGEYELSRSGRWLQLKNDPPEVQIAVLRAVVDRETRRSGSDWRLQAFNRSMLTGLLRRNLPLAAVDLTVLLRAWNDHPDGLEYGLPGPTILGAVERFAACDELSVAMRSNLQKILERASRPAAPGGTPNKDLRAVASRIQRLLASSSGEVLLPSGPFAKQFAERIAGAGPEERVRWLTLARLAAEAGAKSKPTRTWVLAAAAALEPFDRAELTREVVQALDTTTPDPTRPDGSLDILKGLVWMCPQFDHAEVVAPVGRFAERCFRKVPGIGARSVTLGNAALWSLSEMGDEPRAVTELIRLRERLKYPSARKVIEARLSDTAHSGGLSVEDLEDLSLPDFGLSAEGRTTFDLGGPRADLELRADGVELQWFGRDGRLVKSIPTEVRRDRPGALSEVRRRKKEIEDARAGQALRLERSWLEERTWRYEDWCARYLHHPLRRPLVEALIWRIGPLDLMVSGSVFTDIEGQACEPPSGASVTLWHPLDADPPQVLAWRQKILDLGITQPIKQAHREIYVLTDAEVQTSTYSNRFAAHIVRQHQFRALCQARGWTYDLMGAWDSWSVPTRRLPRHGLAAEFSVSILNDGRHSDSGVALYLTTDHVRFTDAQSQPVELDAISPVILSEILRDVDLFVAVTSVANDPAWTDGGPHGQHGDYWREWAFGELGVSAQTRRELISWIVPRLSIADRLEVTDKYLIVEGRRQRYAIHFGSGNVQSRPANRYLCIVPGRDPGETAAIKLPFTGDGVLSMILAKAFLLVDEDKITDPTILSQL